MDEVVLCKYVACFCHSLPKQMLELGLGDIQIKYHNIILPKYRDRRYYRGRRLQFCGVALFSHHLLVAKTTLGLIQIL